MNPGNLKQALLSGTAPKQVRMLIAGGMAPIPSDELMEILVLLLRDEDKEISELAAKTLRNWDAEELYAQLSSPECHPSILEFFSQQTPTDRLLPVILSNPSTPDAQVASLARTVSPSLLETILDNRVRIIRFPEILEGIRQNPASNAEILRLAHEIETEFLGGKKKEYDVGEATDTETAEPQVVLELQSEILEEDLTLEGLPSDPDIRQTEIAKRLSSMSVREKMRYALFGNREIRSMLIRDSNKEIAKTVLRSPKLTDNEVEAIAAMRGVAEDILREIGQSRTWTKSYAVAQNLVRNPKTPPAISQNLLFRLRTPDLLLLTRDRSVSEAVRYNASRAVRQRSQRPSS